MRLSYRVVGLRVLQSRRHLFQTTGWSTAVGVPSSPIASRRHSARPRWHQVVTGQTMGRRYHFSGTCLSIVDCLRIGVYPSRAPSRSIVSPDAGLDSRTRGPRNATPGHHTRRIVKQHSPSEPPGDAGRSIEMQVVCDHLLPKRASPDTTANAR